MPKSGPTSRKLPIRGLNKRQKIGRGLFRSSLSLALMPNPAIDLPRTVFADRVDRPTMPVAEQMAAAALPPQPEQTIVDAPWLPVFPERVLRATLPTAEQPFFAFAPQPERTAPIASETHADLVPRPIFHASQQMFVTGLSPKPEEKIQLDWQGNFPERALRATLPTAEQPFFAFAPQPERTSPIASETHADLVPRPFMHASQQMFVTGLSPKPERNSPVFSEVHTDLVPRPIFHASQQMFVTGLSPKPERTSPIASEVHADLVPRPSMHASQQMAVTGLSPFPIVTVVLGWGAVYPDFAVRVTFELAAYPFVAFAPQPERTSPIASETHADLVPRPAFHASQQMFVTGLSPQPERTSPIASEVHADLVPRPIFHASQQMFVTGLSPKPEEKIQLDWQGNFPERALRAVFLTAEQPFVAFAPQPERTSPIASETHADLVPRPTFHASQQMAVTSISPKPERTSPIASEVHADLVPRPIFHASQQMFVTGLSPKPEEKIQLDWLGNYPERVLRAWLATAEQPFFAFAPQPERTSPIASEVHADLVPRPIFHASQQMAVTGLSPKPEEKIQLDWLGNYPERVLRAWLATSEQPFFAFAPQPERTSLIASETHADLVPRPTFHASQQMFVTGLSPKPERNSPVFSEVHADLVPRPTFHASQQMFVTGLSPQPERTSPMFSEVHADLIARPPALHASQQMAVTGLSPLPIVTLILGWGAVYPDFAVRITFELAVYPFVAFAPQPERTSTLVSEVHADRVDRPIFHASQQMAAAPLPPVVPPNPPPPTPSPAGPVFVPPQTGGSIIGGGASGVTWVTFPDGRQRIGVISDRIPDADRPYGDPVLVTEDGTEVYRKRAPNDFTPRPDVDLGSAEAKANSPSWWQDLLDQVIARRAASSMVLVRPNVDYRAVGKALFKAFQEIAQPALPSPLLFQLAAEVIARDVKQQQSVRDLQSAVARHDAELERLRVMQNMTVMAEPEPAASTEWSAMGPSVWQTGFDLSLGSQEMAQASIVSVPAGKSTWRLVLAVALGAVLATSIFLAWPKSTTPPRKPVEVRGKPRVAPKKPKKKRKKKR